MVHFDAPTADVAAGYYLTLKRWSRGATTAADTANVVDVTTADGKTVFAVPRSDVTVVSSTDGNKWQAPMALSSLYCGGAPCGTGKFSLQSFGALSRFNESGGAVAPASYADGKQVAQAGLPVTNAFAYYGEHGGGLSRAGACWVTEAASSPVADMHAAAFVVLQATPRTPPAPSCPFARLRPPPAASSCAWTRLLLTWPRSTPLSSSTTWTRPRRDAPSAALCPVPVLCACRSPQSECGGRLHAARLGQRLLAAHGPA